VTTGTIVNSNVQINRISYKYTPVAPAPAFTPSVLSFAWPGTLPPGGTEDFDNVPILWPQDFATFAAACGVNNQYDVTVTFTGVEVNTGATLSTDTHISVFCF
jgi:hypothetical protein